MLGASREIAARVTGNQAAEKDSVTDYDVRELEDFFDDDGEESTRINRLRTRTPLQASKIDRSSADPRTADASNPAYIKWLKRQSMLNDADVLSRGLSGQPSMWRNPYARPDSRRAIRTASVWFTAYPISLITRPEQNYLQALGDGDLWKIFQHIGIDAVHTGPVKVAGGIDGWSLTGSIDGHFDRISTRIDPAFGTENDFRALTDAAELHGGSIIDDIVPGHTGKGADFRLAEMGYKDYPGIYHMVEIPEEHWGILPDVPDACDAVNLGIAEEQSLAAHGYIIGQLQRVIFHAPGIKETNWSATAPVLGVDGVTRRWVYLHYFKQGQPSINWLDPTFAGMRLVIGDALHSLGDLRTSALRLDANGFLGVEKTLDGPGWSEGHPLSEAANHLIASMVRKVGGFSFQELNLAIEDIRDTGRTGADLSYDFVNRPAYHHALATADTEFLRLTLRTSLELGVDPVTLVHALQNHDELTYELVHWSAKHRLDKYFFRGREVMGAEVAESVRQDLLERLTGESSDYNLVFTTNGIACTTASVIAAAQGHTSLDEIADNDVDDIRRAHLLLAKFNAWQPGAFALSGWDLLGALPLPADDISHLIEGGDTRWIERGAFDLIDGNPTATVSSSGIPRGRSLYGSLPAQIADRSSFVSGLRRILAVRERYDIAIGSQLEVPDVAHPGLLVLVHRLDGGEPKADSTLQLTVLNFSGKHLTTTVQSDYLTAGATIRDVIGKENIGEVDDHRRFSVSLPPYGGLFLLVQHADE